MKSLNNDSGPERIKIYLSGSIKKGSNDKRPAAMFWSDEDRIHIVSSLPDHQVALLDPSQTAISRNDHLLNFGADLFLVQSSDVLLVDARTKKGIGIGAEMLHARVQGIPCVTICPTNSEYRRDFVADVFGEDLVDWVHPFIAGLSSFVVDDLHEATSLIRELGVSGLRDAIGPDIQSHIQRYAECIQ